MGFWKKRKNVLPKQKISDVFFSAKKEVLYLRDRIFVVEVNIDKLNEFLFEKRKFFKYGSLALFVVVVLIFSINSKADTASFYSNNCLGNWQNPKNAEGVPQVKNNKDEEDFSANNSAILNNTNAELYCGNFSGEIPKDIEPKKFVLKFSILATENLLENTEPIPTTDQIPNTFDDSNSNSDDLPEIETGNENIPDPEPTILPKENEPTLPAEVGEPEPATSSDVPSETTTEPISPTSEDTSPSSDTESSPSPSEPVSSLPSVPFLATAYAEEVLPAENPTTEDTNLPSPLSSIDDELNVNNSLQADTNVLPDPETNVETVSEPEINKEIKTETNMDVETETNTENTEIILETENSDQILEDKQEIVSDVKVVNNYLKVSYTMDGKDWIFLGMINEENIYDPSFVLPLENLKWEDVSKIQISISPVVSIDKAKIFYLDSMWIESDYDKVEIIEALPKIKIKDISLEIISGNADFSNNEDISFKISDPKLSKYKIAQLVNEDKADLLEDKDKVLESFLQDKKKIPPLELPSIPVDENSLKDVKDAIDNVVSPSTSPNTTPPSLPLSGEKSTSPNTTPPSLPLSGEKSTSPNTTSPNLPLSGEKSTSPNTTSPSLPLSGEETSPQPSPYQGEGGNPVSSLFIPKAFAQTLAQITSAKVLDSKGVDTKIETIVENIVIDGEDVQQVKIKKPNREFKPGKYSLRITLLTDTVIIETQKDFTWGVLVVNVNKSIYNPGDDAYLQIGVLDDEGYTICDADLEMEITLPSGVVKHYNTTSPNPSLSGGERTSPQPSPNLREGEIIRNPECGPNNVINTPDYYAYFLDTSEVGEYKIKLTATTLNGVRSINDGFQVDPSAMFDVERVTASRIQPTAVYSVTLYLTARSDFSGTIIEHVPADFEISPPKKSLVYDSVEEINTTPTSPQPSPYQGEGANANSGEESTSPQPSPYQGEGGREKILSWNLDLKRGETKILGYYYDAPNVSPEIFLLGPLEFFSGEKINDPTGKLPAFKEIRQWQIASDAACNATTTGSWSNGSNWTGCSGAGGKPGAGDDITIDSNITITMDEDSDSLGTIYIDSDGVLNTSDGTSWALTGTTLTIRGTLTANASIITLTGTTGPLFDLIDGAGTFTYDTSTVVMNSDADVTLTPDTATAITFYNLSLAPTITSDHYYTFGAGTLTINGDFDINPTNGDGYGIYVTMSADITVSSTGTTNITQTTNAFSQLYTGSGYSLSTGFLNIAIGGDLNADGTGSTITLTGTSGTLFTLNGSFSSSSSTVVMNPDATVTLTSGAITFYNLSLTPTITGDRDYTFGAGALTIDGDFTINPTASSGYNLIVKMGANITVGATTTITRTTSATSVLDVRPVSTDYNLSTGFLNIATGGTLDATSSASTITLTGTSGTLFTLAGTFTTGSSTVVMNPNAAVTLTSGAITFYNLSLTPTITVGRVYTFGAGALTINGDFTINPTASSALALTVNMGANITVASTKTTTITRTTSATSVLDTRPVSTDYNLSTGLLNIATGGTLDATSAASNITLTGTGGTLFTLGGTFTAGSSTTIMNPDAAVTLTSGAITFNNLSLTPTITAGRAYTFGAGALIVNGDFTINPTASSALALTVNMGADITVAATKTTTITRTTSATSVLDVRPVSTDYNLSTGFINIATGGTLDATSSSSTITLTGTSGTLFTKVGTFTVGTSTVNLAGNGTATINSGDPRFYNLTSSGTGTKTLGASLTVSGVLNITNGTFSGGAYGLTLSGTSGEPFPAPGGVFSGGTGTVTYTGNNPSGNTTILGTTYYHLAINNSSETFVPSGAIAGSAVGTQLVITNGTLDTDAINSYAVNFGKVSIANSATAILTANSSVITLNATSGTLFTRGASGVFNQGTSEVKITSATSGGALTLMSSANTFHKLTINTTGNYPVNAGGIITMSNASASNKLYVQTGVLNDGGNTIVGTSNGTLQVDAGAGLCISGTSAGTNLTCDSGATPTTASTFPTNYTNGNITLSATSTVYYNANGTATVSAVPAYGNLYFKPTLASTGKTYTLGGALTINGNFTIDPKASSALALTVNMGGDIAVASGKTTLITRTTSATSVLDTYPVATSYNLSTGWLNVATGGTLDASSSASTITLTGTSGTLFTLGGTFTITSGTPTVTMSGNGDAVINSASIIFYDLTSTGSGVKSAGGAIQIDHDLTVSAGNFDPTTSYVVTGNGTNTLTLNNGGKIRVQHSTFAGSYASFETVTLNTGSTVVYYLNGAQTIDNTISPYSNLKVSTGGTKTLGGDITVSDVLTIDVGATLDGSSYTLTLAGTGSVFANSGTFTASTSTIKLTDASASAKTFAGGGGTFYNFWITGAGTGDYTISGSNTFNDFKVDTPPHTIKFTAGTTTTVTTFTVLGTAGNLMTLKSTSDGSYWELSKASGTIASNYLSLQDSHALGGATFYAGANSTNVSGNTGWSFTSPRFWVGGDGNWSDTAHWSTTSGGSGGAAVPTSADDVFLDANSGAVAVTVDATAYMKSLDTTGFTGSLYGSAAARNMDVYGNLIISSTMSITQSVGFVFNFRGNVSGRTITTSGQTLSYFSFNLSGGDITLQDDVTLNQYWRFSSSMSGGTVYANGKTITVSGQNFIYVSSTGGTFDMTNSTINFSGGNTTPAFGFSPNMTLVTTGSTMNVNMTSSTYNTFDGGSHTFDGTINFTGTGTTTIISTNTFHNLSLDGSAGTSKTVVLSLGANQTIDATGTLTLKGGADNRYRLLVQSNTLGTRRDITLTAGATTSMQRVDFRDIGFASAINLSGITGGAGDAGGNNNITFNTPRNLYWYTATTGTKLWSNTGGATNWYTTDGTPPTNALATGDSPLPQDNVYFNANSIGAASTTISLDVPRTAKDIIWTGVTNTPTWSFANIWTMYGSLTLVSGMNLTHGNKSLYFEGRNSDHTFTSGGKTFYAIYFQGYGGTYTLQDDLITSNFIFPVAGTLTATTQNVTARGLQQSTGSTLNAGSGTFEFTNPTYGSILILNGTFNAQTSTIEISGVPNGGANRISGLATFNNFYISGSATGSNTYEFYQNTTVNGTLTIASPNRIRVNGGQTITMGTSSTVNANGTAGNLIDWNVVSGTTPWQISKASGGAFSVDYWSLDYSKAMQDNTFYAGANSTDGGHNDANGYWKFQAPVCTAVTTGNWSDGTKWIGCTGSGGKPAVGENVTINSGVTTTMDEASAVLGTITINGTLTTSGSNYALSGTTINISSTGTLTANGSTITLSGTSGTLFTKDPSGTFTAGTSTVNLSGNGSATVASGTPSFYNLISSGTGTKSLGVALTATGALTISAGTFDTVSGSNYTVNAGTITVSGGTFTPQASAVNITGTTGTLFTYSSGTFTAGTSIVTMSGNGDAVVNSGAITFYDLVSTGSGVKSVGGAIQIDHDLTVSAGTLDPTASYVITGNGTNTLTVNNGGTIRSMHSTFAGDYASFETVTLNSGSTVDYFLNGDQTIDNTISPYSNLTVSTGRTKTLGGNLTVGNVMTIGTGATLNLSSYTMTLSGTTGVPFVKTGTFTPSTGTVSYVGDYASGNTNVVSTTYYNLTMNRASETFLLAGDITVSGVLTITAGTLDASSYNIILSGTNIGATPFVNSGTFTPNTGTVSYTGINDFGQINVTSATYNNLTVNRNSETFNLAGDITVGGVLTIGASTILDGSSRTITLSGTTGTPFVNSGTFTPSTSTVSYTGNNTGGNTTVVATTYNNLTVNNASETYVLAGTTTANGNLTITAGTLDVTASNHALYVGGNWSNAGTFTAQSGLVTLNSGTTASVGGGPTTFYDLTITHTSAKEVDFSNTALHIIHVTHTFTVTGNSGQLIKLYSASTPNKWHFHPTGTAVVDYADVKDGGCESGAITISPTHSTDSGNNDACWSFYVPAITFGMSGNTADLGTLSTSQSKYATAGAGSGGSTTEVEAHNFTVTDNSPSGYSVSVIGASLTNANGGHVITPIGGTNTAPNPSNEQFGLRMTATGGSGTVSSPYADSGFAYAADGSTASQVSSAVTGDGVTTTYSVRYLSNIAPITDAGTYHATLTYLVTGNF